LTTKSQGHSSPSPTHAGPSQHSTKRAG
jgi:hypothetical protein